MTSRTAIIPDGSRIIPDGGGMTKLQQLPATFVDSVCIIIIVITTTTIINQNISLPPLMIRKTTLSAMTISLLIDDQN